MRKSIVAVCVLLCWGSSSVVIAADKNPNDYYQKINDLERQVILNQKRQEYIQSEQTLKTMESQGELNFLQQEIQKQELRKKIRELGGSDEWVVRSIGSYMGKSEALLVGPDGSARWYSVGDTLPNGGIVLGITDEVLLKKKHKTMVLRQETPKADTRPEVVIGGPGVTGGAPFVAPMGMGPGTPVAPMGMGPGTPVAPMGMGPGTPVVPPLAPMTQSMPMR
jgi:hypothetical protein